MPTTPYELIGGERAVANLVTRFYELMDALPAAQGIRAMHAPDLGDAPEKLRLFLTGWLGGPNVYVERYGPPFLRARHLPFAIGTSERDQWMLCMRQALDECIADRALRDKLYEALWGLANHMRNRADPGSAAGTAANNGAEPV